MRKIIFGLFVALYMLGVTAANCNAKADSDATHLSAAAEEGCVIGTVTQQELAPRSENLLQVRKKRERHQYQEPPKNLANQYQVTVKANAYCLRGMTSRGVPTRVGVVAVDPRVIPYGSKIHIPGYGWATALDTGGAIKGHTIDIWMPTYDQCMQWGSRNIKITVVKPG